MKKTGKVAAQKIRIISSELDKEIKNIEDLYKKLRDHERIQTLMAIQAQNSDEAIENEISTEISEILRGYSYGDISINSIFAFDTSKQVLDPLYKISPYSTIVEAYKPFHTFVRNGQFSSFFRTNFFSK